jgi:hypothetical protein
MHAVQIVTHDSDPSYGPGPPRWVPLAGILVALLFATGAVIALARPALLVASDAAIDAATHVSAGYLASRDSALAVALVVVLVLRARQLLAGALLLAALIQVADIVVDATTGRLVLVPGLAVLTALMLVLPRGLCGGRCGGSPRGGHGDPPRAPASVSAPQHFSDTDRQASAVH